jgi:hypothetical protein
MRRSILVLALPALLATTMVLPVGAALATNANPNQTSYTDTFNGHEYKAAPGEGRFRATADGDLPGELDATIFYTGSPGPNVTSEITEGTWILCEQFTDPPRNATGKLIVDVYYDRLVADPISTVRDIYDHYNLAWSEEFAERLNYYVQQNPRGKHGAHRYAAEDFGQTGEAISERFAAYIERFELTRPNRTQFLVQGDASA